MAFEAETKPARYLRLDWKGMVRNGKLDVISHAASQRADSGKPGHGGQQTLTKRCGFKHLQPVFDKRIAGHAAALKGLASGVASGKLPATGRVLRPLRGKAAPTGRRFPSPGQCLQGVRSVAETWQAMLTSLISAGCVWGAGSDFASPRSVWLKRHVRRRLGAESEQARLAGKRWGLSPT